MEKRINDDYDNDIFYKTNVEKINGYYFCYKHKSYKELLYNDQIKKYGEKFDNFYKKDCGIIDTLNQHLCIKDTEKCPLYDIWIGENIISPYFNYNEIAKVYYNNDNYNGVNKKILGKLILSQGQPCYVLNEKLWRKFHNIEAIEGHLECELNIFDKITNDKFKYKGDISYKKLYEDNLSKEDQNIILQYIRGYENVSLYTREFIGIDKSCDNNFNLNKDDHEIIIKNQNKERNCFIAEFIFISMVLSLYAKIMNSEIFKDFDKSESFFFDLFINYNVCIIAIFYFQRCFFIENNSA